MTPLLSKEEIDTIDLGDESDQDITSTEMLENICDGSQSHLSVNLRESHYKIRDHISQRQLEWKGALKSMQNIGKGLHKVFKTVAKEILQDLPSLVEYG